MRILDGRELAGYVKERQAKQVRALRQAHNTFPKLAIIVANNDPVISMFVRLKESYSVDVLIETDVHTVGQTEVAELIQTLNVDPLVHGIVLQLPLTDDAQTDQLVKLIAPEKDVDGLGSSAIYGSATATAIDWLLNGYNVMLKEKKIVVVGQGRLVGKPLTTLWQTAGLNVLPVDNTVSDLSEVLRTADIIVTATGAPGLVTSRMIAPGKVVVDAGTASENGQIVGDLAADVRDRNDLTITPEKGGVGPLTIAALYDNVITAARKTVPSEES